MVDNLLKVRGKDLYVEVHGSDQNPAMLYLHGGPGESCIDFCYHQMHRLSTEFRVVAIDQRGVCRSEGITEEDNFRLMDIIDDCEALREQLGISTWSLLGHSFGGFLALLYAMEYPESIDRIIFECPTFDFELTARNLLRKTARLFLKYDNEELQIKCLQLAEAKLPTSVLVERYGELSQHLGSKRMEIYTYNFGNRTDYSTYTDEQWETFGERSSTHYSYLQEEGKMFESLLHKIKDVPHPMLLVVGRHDPVTCPHQIKAFQEEAQNGELIFFEDSGHTPHYEAADKFSYVVSAWLRLSTKQTI